MKSIGYKYSPLFLEHSLQENPENMIFTDGDIIKDIETNEYFKNKVNEIIKKHSGSNSFYTGEKKESFSFSEGDLFYSINNSYIDIRGNKVDDKKWNLDIILSDTYDFTDFKEIREYMDKDNICKALFGSTGYNLAMIGNSCKVVNTYEITIKFRMENWEEF